MCTYIIHSYTCPALGATDFIRIETNTSTCTCTVHRPSQFVLSCECEYPSCSLRTRCHSVHTLSLSLIILPHILECMYTETPWRLLIIPVPRGRWTSCMCCCCLLGGVFLSDATMLLENMRMCQRQTRMLTRCLRGAKISQARCH